MQCVNIFDYFATIGSADPSDLRAQPLTDAWSEQATLQPSEAWMDAIVDIAVVQPGEQLPNATWQLIGLSLDGVDLLQSSTFTSLLAVQRRSGNYRLDHIIDIKVAQSDAVMPEGYDVVGKSITGTRSSRLCCGLGYILFKRASTSPKVFLEGACIITDLCVVLNSQGETVPETFYAIDRLRGPAREVESVHGAASDDEDVVLACYEQGPVGICDLGYSASTLDRYPSSDDPQFPLPMKELPLFAFPNDMRLKLSYQGKFPVPIYFSFVFTDINADHQYVACLRFYEALPCEGVSALLRTVYGDRHPGALEDFNRLGATIFCPRAICVLSRRPVYRAMRAYLRQLFSLSMSALPCPLEYFISSVVASVPAPLPGGRPLHLYQDLALIGGASKPMAALRFQVPEKTFFSHADMDFAGPLRCLSVEKLLAVFALILSEVKIVFMCSSHAIITETMETLRALLMPLSWSSCFVSRLPSALSGMLGALGGFMIGLQLPEGSSCDHDYDEYLEYDLVLSGDEGAFDSADSSAVHIVMDNKSRQRGAWLRHLQRGTFIVDLSANAISEFNGSVEVPLSPRRVTEVTKLLPLGPRRRLEATLTRLCQVHGVRPHALPLSHFDSAVESPPPDGSNVEFPALDVRDAFMLFMADSLGNFARYIIPPSSSLSEMGFRTFQESFRVADYISDSDSSMRPFTETVVHTQMFATLLQRRFDGSDFQLDFFERVSLLMHKCRLSAGGHGIKIPQFSTFPIPDMPAPMHKLLAAYETYTFSLRHRAAMAPASATASPAVPEPSFSPTSWGRSHENTELIQAIMAHMESSESAGGTSSSVKHLKDFREEIDLPADLLLLHDISKGPLVLPGPVSTDLPEGSTGPEDCTRDADGRYCYNSWPSLSKELLAHSGHACVHRRMRDIRARSVEATDAAAAGYNLLTRPRCRRLNSVYRLARPQREEGDLILAETYLMFCAFVDIAASLMLLLQARVLTRSKPISDMLQLIGIISQLEDRNLIGHIDEDLIRGIFVCCRSASLSGGGDFVRKIAISMMESTVSRSEVELGSLVIGQYTLSLQRPRSGGGGNPSSATGAAPTVSEIDTFGHLEAIGLTWFSQRAPQFRSSKQLQLGSGAQTTPAKPSSVFTSMFSSNNKVKRDTSSRRSVVKATGATRVVAAKLNLIKSAGMMSFVATSSDMHFHSPLQCDALSSDDTRLDDARRRTAERYESLVAAHTEVWASELERYTLSRLTESTRPSLSPRQSEAGTGSSSTSPLKNSVMKFGSYLSKQMLTPGAETESAPPSTTIGSSFGQTETPIYSPTDSEQAAQDELVVHAAIQAAFEARARASGSITTLCSSACCRACGLSLMDEEVFALWCGFPCFCDGSGGYAANSNGQLLCPHCHAAIRPQLTVSSNPQSGAPAAVVDYLSPHQLRQAIEELLESHGALAVDPQYMRELQPSVYWTVLWFASRTNMPSGMRAGSVDCAAPVIIGWREAVAIKQAQALLALPPGEPVPEPKLKDLLPEISAEIVAEVYRALEAIDESMIPLIMALSAYERSSSSSAGGGRARARRIYVDLVACVHLFDRLCPPSDGQLGKSARLDKEYQYVLINEMAPEHFSAMGIEQRELLASVASEATQAFRLGLGFIF